MVQHAVKQGIVILAMALGIAACSASDIPLVGEMMSRPMTVANIPEKDEVIRNDSSPAIVTLDLKSSLRERRLSRTEDLPKDVILPTTNLNGVPITAALQAVLSGTDISLSWGTGSLGSRLVTVMNLRGPLPTVVDKICSAARVFCSYRHGSIELSEKETFVITLPPIERIVNAGSATGSSSSRSSSSSSSNLNNSIVEAINQLLGGEKATIDNQGGTIMYTATVDAEERISRYLTELRTERPLIVLQLYIWEVTLDRENAQGINWTTFQTTALKNTLKNTTLSLTSNLTSLATTTGSVGLGAVTTGEISANAVASFIATKGRVQTISNPQITFVSGSYADLKIGGTQRYISEVGTATSNTSGTTSSSSNTVSTDEIETGLAIAVAGSYENGIVFANLDMSLKNLVSLNPTKSGDYTIDLPETTDEKINTVLRVRPGDSLVLAGLVSSNDTGSSQGFPVGGDSAIPLYGDTQRQNRELVIIVKPSIVQFSNEYEKREKKPYVEKTIGQADSYKPLSEALPVQKLSDEKDIRPVELSQPKQQSSLYDPPAEEVSVAPVDKTPVDDSSATSGFFHAFDKLFQSPDPSIAGGGK